MKNWQKLGLIYEPKSTKHWCQTHASNPVAQKIEEDLFRIFFTCRDKSNRSSITFLDLHISETIKIIKHAKVPILQPGCGDDFDKDGVTSGDAICVDGELYFYYMGWNVKQHVPWKNTIGLAKSVDFASENPLFKKTLGQPVLGIDEHDPHTISYPSTLKENGLIRMWYGSNTSWGDRDKKFTHVIKHATSKDGLIWNKTKAPNLKPKAQKENIVIRPSVIRLPSGYKMFFSAKGSHYKIHSAESRDGISWLRSDQAELLPSESGWDSEMVCYPYVFEHKSQYYMLYCGNTFGKTGFGLALAID